MDSGQEDRLEVSEIGRMTSVSKEKTCEIDEWLGSKVEGIDKTLDSSLDEMLCENEEETFSELRAGVMICFSWNIL